MSDGRRAPSMAAPLMKRLSFLLLALAYPSAACVPGARSTPARPVAATAEVSAENDACDAARDPRCANLISRLVLPRLQRLGLGAPEPEPTELCRRLAIDILGRGPDEADRAACAKGKVEDTVTAWTARPEADRVERRYWADLAQYM